MFKTQKLTPQQKAKIKSDRERFLARFKFGSTKHKKGDKFK